MTTETGGIFLQQILNLYRFNSDSRKKYMDAIEQLSWDEVVKDRGASFHSIRNVFLHILNAYRYWFPYGITDNMKEYQRIDSDSCNGIDDLRRWEHEVDSMVTRMLEDLREEDFSRLCVIHYDDGTSWQGTMESILIHMIEEELQHRGEINCMFWQQDIDPPDVQYHDWVKEKAVER